MKAVELNEQHKHGVHIIKPIGRLDSGQIDRLEHVINERIEEGKVHLVIDCAEVYFMASSALRVLLLTAKRIDDAEGALILCNMKPPIERLMAVAGFEKLLKHRNTLAEAIDAAKPPDWTDADDTAEQTAEMQREAGRTQRSESPSGGTEAADEDDWADEPSLIWLLLTAPFRILLAMGEALRSALSGGRASRRRRQAAGGGDEPDDGGEPRPDTDARRTAAMADRVEGLPSSAGEIQPTDNR